MTKKIIGILGAVFFLVSLYFLFTLYQEEKNAVSRDSEKTAHGIVQGPPLCIWNADVSERVMSEDKSQALLIHIDNPASENCVSILSLRSPGFDITPSKDEQTITLQKGSKGFLSWIMTPRKTGTYEIAVSDSLNTKILGITVTNTFGFTTGQTKLFSIIGSMFGPMTTIPWWFEKLWTRRKQKKEEPVEK